MKHIPANRMEWIKDFEGIQGVDASVLWPKPNGGVSLLIKMAKGSTIPAHKHTEYEETYMVSGKVDAGNGVTAVAGDCILMDTNDPHAVTALEETVFFVSIESGFDWVKQ